MKSFGVWLWQNRARGTGTQQLYDAAVRLGPQWPIASTRRTDYEASFAQDPQHVQLMQALEQLWPVYEGEETSTKLSFFDVLWNALSSIGAWGVALGGFALLLFFLFGLRSEFITQMRSIESARGLLTFLFAIGTVGIAVVIVLANFLSSATGEDLSQRVQNGKDVLTTLIGVFGAILGFYFGALEDQAGRQGGAPPTPTEEQGFLQPTPPRSEEQSGLQSTSPPPEEPGGASPTPPVTEGPGGGPLEKPPNAEEGAASPTPR
jgi:hypothetical protein